MPKIVGTVDVLFFVCKLNQKKMLQGNSKLQDPKGKHLQNETNVIISEQDDEKHIDNDNHGTLKYKILIVSFFIFSK